MKKYLTLILAAALALSMTACEPKSEQTDTTTQTPDTTKTPTTTPRDGNNSWPTDTYDYSTSAWTPPETVETTTVPERPVTEKPVIYLYPTTDKRVSVKLDYNGALTATYPAYHDGWTVQASPDGTLTDPVTGRTYYCLYWEGIDDVEYDLSKGFVIPGADTAAFLEDALAKLGLTEREANEFIIYWLPRMEGNAYNLITFQNDAYTDNAPLTVTPAPDSMLRVFMAWKPLDKPVDIAPQELPTFERHGFAVVEWGGTELN